MRGIETIKQEYLKLHGEMIKEQQLMKPTEKGYSGSASAETMYSFFRSFGLENHSGFLDLGSGDGKVVLVASLFTNAHGVEIDRQLVSSAENIRKRLGISSASFMEGDFLDTDISGYEVLFINPDQPLHEIEKKLRAEMSAGQRLVVFGGLYKPLNMRLEKEYNADGVWFGVYSP